jgi:hypothetical protein
VIETFTDVVLVEGFLRVLVLSGNNDNEFLGPVTVHSFKCFEALQITLTEHKVCLGLLMWVISIRKMGNNLFLTAPFHTFPCLSHTLLLYLDINFSRTSTQLIEVHTYYLFVPFLPFLTKRLEKGWKKPIPTILMCSILCLT